MMMIDSPRRAEAVIESARRAEAVIDSPRRADAVIDSPPARRHIGALPSGLPGVAASSWVLWDDRHSCPGPRDRLPPARYAIRGLIRSERSAIKT